jgi:hypothetical protein
VPLLKTTLQIKEHNSAIQNGLTFENIISYRDSAEDKHLIPMVGRSFYNVLIARIADAETNALTAKEIEVIRLLTKASANLAIAYYTSFGSVQLSNSGAHVSFSDTQRIASDKKISELKNNSFLNGFDAVYQAVEYLHQNYEAAEFATYFAGDAYDRNYAYFLQIPSDCQYIEALKNNAWLFDKLKAAQLKVVDTFIISILGDDLYGTIQTARKEQTSSALQKELLKKIQKAVSFLTVAEGIAQNALVIDAGGIFATSESTGGITGNFQMKMHPLPQESATFMHTYLTRGESEMESIKKFLNTNIDAFPGYTAQTTGGLSPINVNSDDNNFFFT